MFDRQGFHHLPKETYSRGLIAMIIVVIPLPEFKFFQSHLSLSFYSMGLVEEIPLKSKDQPSQVLTKAVLHPIDPLKAAKFSEVAFKDRLH